MMLECKEAVTGAPVIRCSALLERLPKPYYQDEWATIYNASSDEVLPRIETDSVDLVVTSPPYNKANSDCSRSPLCKGARLRKGYEVHGDAMDESEYDEWQRRVLKELWRISRLAVAYNHKPRIQDGQWRAPLGLDFGGLIPRQVVIWKTGAGINLMPRAFAPAHEWVMIFAKNEWSIGKQWSSIGDVWEIQPTCHPEHPAPYPIQLPARLIESCGAKTVLDPYAGTGTTIEAAKLLGCRAIGIEINERYCEIAARRMAQGVLAL